MPPGQLSQERLGVDPKKYQSFSELPLVHTGCDSYSSWDPRFKKFSASLDIDTIVDSMLALTPNHHWLQDNGNRVHLVITGGEPLLGWQRSYIELLSHPRMSDLRDLTFETNGTQPLHDDFRDYLWNFVSRRGECYQNLTFSVSPKLSVSGESWSDAIQPELVVGYEHIGHTYLKFVVGSVQELDEVDQATSQYRKSGFRGPVYVMPVGGTKEQYESNLQTIADPALARGYYISPRLHCSIWGNHWGR